MANANLSAAKRAKNDEFYTQLTDIEKELRHYRRHFKGKTVLCNCDDPFESNFFKYFALNFNRLHLKRLICTCYAGSPVSGTSLERPDGGIAYKAVVNVVHDANGDGFTDMDDIKVLFESGENELVALDGDGDFRSLECIELLKEADIVCTNPPFSLFREYVALLMEYEKKFIIIGNINAVTYKEFFPLIKEDKVWPGHSFNKAMVFAMPESYESKTDERDDLGRKLGKVPAIAWYTNLDIKKRHEELVLVEEYDPNKYPKYDNYDAIEVSRTNLIPCDYAGVMGVPITFLDKYNPDQFEIVGDSQRGCHDISMELKTYEDYREVRQDGTLTGSSGNKTNGNPNIARNDGKHNYFIDAYGHVVQSCYNRIFIRNRHPESSED